MDIVRKLLQRWPWRATAAAPSPKPFVKRVRTAFRLDDQGWQTLVAELSTAAGPWSRSDWLALPVRDRVALHCAAAGKRREVDELNESRTVYGPSFLVDRESGRIDLGLVPDVPGWLFEAQDHDLNLRVSLEVAGTNPVVVAGTSFISGLSFDPTVDVVRVEAITTRRTIVADLTMRPDAAADAESGERWADQTAASWWTRLDIDRFVPFTVVVTIQSGGIERRTEVTVPALTQPADVAIRATGGSAVVLAAEVETLRVASATEEWGSGTCPLALDARSERFGLPASIPTGRYSLTGPRDLDLADADVLTRPLADRAIDLGEVLVTLRGWSPEAPGVSLTVRNPIPVEQRGRRRQRLLLAEVRENPGPLHERAVAMCFGGTGAGDSVAPIARELVRRGIPVDWCVTDHSVSVPAGMRPVLLHSREWHEAFTQARYLVNNAEFPHYVAFREGQRYLQTWHGTPLKRIGRDIIEPRLSAGYTAAMAREALMWEALLAQNSFAGEVLPRAFGFGGRTLVEGYPRNDALVTDGARMRRHTRDVLGLGDELVVLYAPTWRDARDEGGRRAFVSHLDAAQVHEQTGATVLVRSHSNSAASRGRLAEPGVVDVTAHPDITALLAAADVLVTDYSSVMFDFAVTERLQVLLVPDVADYRDNRGFYLNLEESSPGPIVTSTEQVVAVLNGEDDSAEARARFRQRFAPLDDGQAARRVVDAWLAVSSSAG